VKVIGNLRIAEVDPITACKKYFICSDHFEDDAFRNPSTKVKRLKADSKPNQLNTKPISDETMNALKIGIESWKGKFRKKCNHTRVLKAYIKTVKNVPGNIAEPISITWDSACIESFLADSLSWYTCEQCKEKCLLPLSTAKRCRHGKKCDDFSESNNMDPGEVPDELNDLTFIEEQLIALIHPIVSYFKLKGLQYGYRGNVINFPQNVNEFAKELPHKIQDLSIIVQVRRKTGDNEYHDFRVRSNKIKNALIWLKAHNSYYKDIAINENSLGDLPVDGNILPHLIVEDEISGDFCNDNNINDVSEEHMDIDHSGVAHTHFPHQQEQIKAYLNWPKLDEEPVDEFNTPGYIACAFPTLFPFGNADLRQHRNNEIKTSSYFKHLIHYQDQRFAKHTTFRFFAYNSWMRWSALNDGNIFVEKHQEFKNMTVEKLKDLVAQNPTTMKQIMFYASNLRGTKAFWHTRANELRDLVEQIGLPTVFLTLSCADGHWDGLFKLLTGKDETTTITETERRKLIQDNPKIVDEFFNHRVESFIKHVSTQTFIKTLITN